MRFFLFLFGLFCLLACSMQREPKPLPAGFLGLEAVVVEPAKHGWIGVDVAFNDSDSLESLDFQPGVRVVNVDPLSPAAAQGILVGDVMLSFDGTLVDDPVRLETLLARVDSVRSIRLELQRGAEVMEADVVAQVRGGGRPRTKYFIDRALLRVAFEDSGARGTYPQIAWLAEDSPLWEAGLDVGDRIELFQNRDPGSAKELVRRIHREISPGDEASFSVSTQDGEKWTIVVQAWEPERELTRVAIFPLIQWTWDRVERREKLILGDLILTSIFQVEQVGGVKKWSILSLIQWETGEALLEEIKAD